MQGLSYPWPAVAKRSSEAIVKLERTDLIPQLLGVLDRPDARAPQALEKAGKKTTVVRELVRINHHRNCLLCHAPSDPQENVSAEKAQILESLTAQVPLPDQPLPTPSPDTGGYGNSSQDILVRIDVTYLRQDFSVKLPVANSQPWPEMQRSTLWCGPVKSAPRKRRPIASCCSFDRPAPSRPITGPPCSPCVN